MNSATIPLACIVALPIAIIIILRINATLVFLSLCLGAVLAQFVSTDSSTLTNFITTSNISYTLRPTYNTWRLVLLLLPVITTMFIMIKTVRGNSKMVFNVLPAIGVGFVGALLVVPLLPKSAAHEIISSPLWKQMSKAQAIIVGVSAIICLSMIFMMRPKNHDGKHSKHGH